MVFFTRTDPSQIPGDNLRASLAQEERGSGWISGSQPGSFDSSLQSRPRSHTENHKRLSVFGSGRSRTNTGMLGSSSYQSPATSITSVDMPSRRPSEDGRVPQLPLPPPTPPPTSGFYASENVAKSLLSRGTRILRRQGSKFSLTSSVTLDEIDQNEKERYKVEVSELFHRGQKTRTKSSQCLKNLISEPYGFHHVTHTHRSQFQTLERVSDNELVTEFSAIRAAQKPRTELKGIRADHLHHESFSSDRVQQADLSEGQRSPISPVTPPRTRDESRSSITPPGHEHGARPYRSVENFSRPVSKSPRSPVSPIAPPQRFSSRNQCPPPFPEPSAQVIDAILGLNTDPSDAHPSSADGKPLPSSPPSAKPLPVSPADLKPLPVLPAEDREFDPAEDTHPQADDSAVVGHAVTTLDDSARLLRPSLLVNTPSDLADVPEEEETFFWQGSNGRSSRPSTGRSSLRHAQSFPSTRFSLEQPASISRHSSAAFDQSLMAIEKDIGSPFSIEQVSPQRVPAATKRFSIGLKAIEIDNWEDEIDYCYEHAAEADCDLEWDQKANHAQEQRSKTDLAKSDAFLQEDAIGDEELLGAGTEQSRFYPGAFRPSPLSPAPMSVPELEEASALTASTIPEVLTPQFPNEYPPTLSTPDTLRDSDRFKPAPSLMVSSGYENELSHEAMYEKLLSSADEPEHFPFYAHATPDSPRSSRSPISKCNSQESMMLSRAASVAHKHGSSNSSGSLPDLVHSGTASRDSIQQDSTDPTQGSSWSDMSAPTTAHRRSKSLMKDVGHQSILKLAAGVAGIEDVEAMPSSSHPAALTDADRSRSASDFGTLKQAPASPSRQDSPTVATFATRLRSGSGPRSRRSSRASYSLFPSGATTPRSPPT